MTGHYNQLTPAQAERLAMLAEECGEVIQIVGKILRHGYESYHPNDQYQTSNRELLQQELVDLNAVQVGLNADINVANIFNPTDLCNKWESKQKWVHHQWEEKAK